MNGSQCRSTIRSLTLRQNAEGRNTRRRRTDGRQLAERVESPCGRQGPRAATGAAPSGSPPSGGAWVTPAREENERSAGRHRTDAVNSIRSRSPSTSCPPARLPSPSKRVGTRCTAKKWKSSMTSHRPSLPIARPSPRSAA